MALLGLFCYVQHFTRSCDDAANIKWFCGARWNEIFTSRYHEKCCLFETVYYSCVKMSAFKTVR